MAEAAINRFIPSGYDEDFVVPPDEDLHCIICQLPSKGPVLTRCGHRFCRECLEEYLRRQEQEGCQLTCPTDREALERNKDIFPDKLIERKILSLLIKCPSEGCEWNGELRAKEEHLAFCIFKDVSCTNENCEVKVARKDLTEHVTTTCQWRILKCVYCGEHYPQCQIEGNSEPDQSDEGIFETEEGKLAFIHHKKVTIISNFKTKAISSFQASNVAGYIFEVASHERTWQCALTLGQLCDSRVVMGILQNHCQDALWYRVPRDAPSYVDLGAYMYKLSDDYRISGNVTTRNVATIYPAWQRCGTFVVSNNLQINPVTRTCLPVEERFILYENSWRKNRSRGADDSVAVNVKQPFSKNGLKDLILSFKDLLSNNYPAACLVLGGTVMSLGYQRIIQAGGSCPVMLLTGDTETSKTTILKACLSITGNSEARDFTAKKALERSKTCDIPFAWDDPTSKEDVKFIVQALFNQAGKDTVHSSGYPRSPPIISANFACANDKRIFSRQAIILFERPNPQLPSQIMATKKAALDKASKQASTGFLEALCLIEKFLDPSSANSRTLISNRIEGMFPGRIRSTDIYSKVMWFTTEVMQLVELEEEVPQIWEYLQSKVAPFIAGLFSGVQDSSSTPLELTCSTPHPTIWDILADVKHPLSKKQAAMAFKVTYINCCECLAIAYDVAATLLKQPTDGKVLLKELMKCPNAVKGRLNFLSPESETDSFRVSRGKYVFGKSVVKQCVSIPLSDIPEKLLHTVQVTKEVSASSSLMAQAKSVEGDGATNNSSDIQVVGDNSESGDMQVVGGSSESVKTKRTKSKRRNPIDSLKDGLSSKEAVKSQKRSRKPPPLHK